MKKMKMKKIFNNLLCLLLACVMFSSTSITTLAANSTVSNSSTSKSVIITDKGVSINGTYFNKTEFIQLLDNAVQVNNGNKKTVNMASTILLSSVDSTMIRTLLGLYAGTWEIPGLGEVVLITAAGVIVIAGVKIASGWIYDAVVDYFQNKAYKESKSKGEKTNNHSTQTGGSLDTEGDENSSKDLKDSNGLKQRRYYDKNGEADMDIDYRHGGNGKEPFPHRHDWNDGQRGPAYWV